MIGEDIGVEVHGMADVAKNKGDLGPVEQSAVGIFELNEKQVDDAVGQVTQRVGNRDDQECGTRGTIVRCQTI